MTHITSTNKKLIYTLYCLIVMLHFCTFYFPRSCSKCCLKAYKSAAETLHFFNLLLLICLSQKLKDSVFLFYRRKRISWTKHLLIHGNNVTSSHKQSNIPKINLWEYLVYPQSIFYIVSLEGCLSYN